MQSGNMAPWWIVFILWPLSLMSFTFAYLMLRGLPGVYGQRHWVGSFADDTF